MSGAGICASSLNAQKLTRGGDNGDAQDTDGQAEAFGGFCDSFALEGRTFFGLVENG